jgi:hypothetical protein
VIGFLLFLGCSKLIDELIILVKTIPQSTVFLDIKTYVNKFFYFYPSIPDDIKVI